MKKKKHSRSSIKHNETEKNADKTMRKCFQGDNNVTEELWKAFRKNIPTVLQ